MGQAMDSFATGVQQGYGFVDNAISKRQDREIQQQQAKQQADLRAEQIKQAQMKSGWMTELDDANNPQAQLNKVQQESQQAIAEVTKQSQKMNGMNMDMDINGLTVQPTIKDRDEYLQSVNAKIKSNPQAYSALGLKGKLEVLNVSSRDDKSWMATHLEKRGINPKDLDLDITDPADQDIWDEVLTKAMDIYPVVKDGENRVDMNELGIGSGSINKATPAVRKQIEANMQMREDELYNLVQEKRVGKDGVDANFNNATDDVTPKLDVEIDEEATKALATDDASVTAMQEGATGIDMVEEAKGDFVAKDVGDFKAKTIQERYDSVGDKAQNFYKDFTAWAGEKGIDVAMAEGARDQARQEELYAQGRTKPGPIVTWTKNSKHKDGNAMDVVAGDYQNAEANTTVAKAMRQFAKENPQYGASFLSIAKDPNHVQFDGTSQDPKQAIPTTKSKTSQDRIDFLYSALGMTNPNSKDTKNSKYLSGYGKLIAEQADYPVGSKEWLAYEKQKVDKADGVPEAVKAKMDAAVVLAEPDKYTEAEVMGAKALITPSAVRTQDAKEIKTENVLKIADSVDLAKPVDNQDYALEAKTRNDKGLYTSSVQKAEQDLNNMMSSHASLGKLQKALESSKYDSGILDNALNYMKGIAPDEMAKKSIEQIEAESKGGVVVAQIVKDLSGLAVTDAEFQRTLKNVMGDPSMQPSEKVTRIKSYIEGFNDRLEAQAKDLGRKGLTVTSKKALGRIAESNKASKVEPAKADTRPSRTINGETRYWDGAKWVN